MFGKLTWQSIVWDQPIPLYTAAFVGLILAAVLLSVKADVEHAADGGVRILSGAPNRQLP